MNKPEKIDGISKGPGQWTETAGLGKGPIPVTGCTSPEYFDREIEHIFKKTWLCAGREEEVPEPGSFIVKDYPAMKTSLLIVRGKDSKVRAFHNICSHRCNKLKWDDQGKNARLTCKFHGWTYDLEGNLINIPDEDQFFNLNKSDHGLTEVATEVWEGFVFFNLDPNPKQTLEQHMPNFYHGLKGYPFHEMTRCYAWQLEMNCNWKLVMDAFAEVYHVPYVHNLSVADTFSSKDRPMPHALNIDIFGNEMRLGIWGNTEFAPPPGTAIAFKNGTAIVKRGQDASELPEFMNPTRSANWAWHR